jgi:hypothetical protein
MEVSRQDVDPNILRQAEGTSKQAAYAPKECRGLVVGNKGLNDLGYGQQEERKMTTFEESIIEALGPLHCRFCGQYFTVKSESNVL